MLLLPSTHVSRDCLLRIRHHEEKQAKLKKTNIRPADVQMMTLVNEPTQRIAKAMTGLMDALAIAQVQAKEKSMSSLPRRRTMSSGGENVKNRMVGTTPSED